VWWLGRFYYDDGGGGGVFRLKIDLKVEQKKIIGLLLKDIKDKNGQRTYFVIIYDIRTGVVVVLGMERERDSF
jgi:hypothetical protein